MVGRVLIMLGLCLLATAAHAQRTAKVEGEYTYYAPENVTLEEARRTALDRARIQAIADEFGTVVSQASATVVSNRDGRSSVDFTSVGGSEVRGEWIETIGVPEYTVRYEDGMLAVSVRVRGRVREIVSAQPDLGVHVLRNGTEDKFESDHFRSGDDLYLSFLSPVSGYMAVYLVDADRQAFCLLPYRSQQEGICRVEANQRYVFFCATEVSPQERPLVDEYTMTCGRSEEHNQLYVVFSPHPFVKAVDGHSSNLLPRQLGYEDFCEWLAMCRKRDKDMVVKMNLITVKKAE